MKMPPPSTLMLPLPAPVISLTTQAGTPPPAYGSGGPKKMWHGPVAPCETQSPSVAQVSHVLSEHRRLLNVAPPPFATGPESVQAPHVGWVAPAHPLIPMVIVSPTYSPSW